MFFEPQRSLKYIRLCSAIESNSKRLMKTLSFLGDTTLLGDTLTRPYVSHLLCIFSSSTFLQISFSD